MTGGTGRGLRLSLNVSGVGRHGAAWTHPASAPGAELDPDHYVRVAREAERGLFDAVFLADTPQLGGDERSIPFRFEPLTLLTAVAAATGHIGLIGTVSTTYNDPRTVADRVLSLHTLSGGRAALNAVASAGDRIARNFGLDGRPAHGDRYARADRFLTAVRDRWSAAGPLPHGRPLVVQAGGSERGRELAARHADVVYAGGHGIADAEALTADIRRRAGLLGRPPGSPLVLPGVVPFIGSTAREAAELAEELDAVQRGAVDPLAFLGGVTGLDLSGRDPDGPLPDGAAGDGPLAGASLAGLARALGVRDGLTIRQIADRLHIGGFGNIQTRLTGTPPEIARTLLEWHGRGVDGFNLLLPLQPSGVTAFVDEVVPLLQRAGAYRTGPPGGGLADRLGTAPPALSGRTA